MEETKDQKFERLCKAASLNVWGFIEFDGWNCHDLGSDWNNGQECRGWDGRSNRCDCGNRRVSWVLDYNSNGVHAEAY